MVLGTSSIYINHGNGNGNTVDIQKLDPCKYFDKFKTFYDELKKSRVDPITKQEYGTYIYSENLSEKDKISRFTSKRTKYQ